MTRILHILCALLCIASAQAQKISELPSGTATGASSLVIVQSGSTFRVTATQLLATGSLTYQGLDADLTAIAELSTSAFGRSLLTQADAAALRSTAGLVIGTNVQAFDADLSTLASGTLPNVSSGTWSNGTAVNTALTGSATLNGAILPINAQVIQNIEGLNRTFDDFMRFNTATDAAPQHLAFTGFADSMPSNIAIYMIMELANKYGLGALYTPELGMSWNGATATLSGGAAVQTSDYTILPSASMIKIPAGGSYQLTIPDFNINPDLMTYLPGGDLTEARLTSAQNRIPLSKGIRAIKVFYVKSATSGTITASFAQPQYSATSVTISGTGTYGLGTINLTTIDRVASGTLTVTASGTAVDFLGAQFLTGDSGVSYWSSAKGSTKMDDQLPGLVSGTWNAVYSQLCTEIGTTAVIHAQRATDAGDEANHAAANYQTFFSAYSALNLGQVVIGEPHRNTENALTTDAINITLGKICNANRIAFFDRKRVVLLGSGTSLGWSDGDDIHRDARENIYNAGMLLTGVNYFHSAAAAQMLFSSSASRRGEALVRMTKTARITPAGINSTGTNLATATFAGTGYANPQVNFRRGFVFASGTALGNCTGVIGQVPAGASQWETQTNSIVVTMSGDRNLSLPQGTEALLTFGAGDPNDGDAWITTTGTSAFRYYGVQFANGTDVGIGGTFSALPHLRLWWRDTSSVYYSRWVPCISNPSGNGLNLIVDWNKVSGRLSLWMGSNITEVIPRINVEATQLSSNATLKNGIQCTIGARNTDWGNGYGASPTPSSTGLIQWRDITVEYWKP